MSAAKRVAHAAETIRARWERDVASDPQTEAAQALEDTCQLLDPEVAAELDRLRVRLDEVHRIPQDNLTPAEVRLTQYGERTKTWSTATHDSGTERALHEIACALRDTLEETRDQRNAARLKVLGLEAERHTTNEALSDAAEQLRVNRDRIAELEKRPTVDAVAGWLRKKAREYPTAPERQESVPDAIARLASKVLRGAVRPSNTAGVPPLMVFRASHDSIVMGLYETAAAAREHCEALVRREMPDNSLDWIEDEEDGVAELTAWVGGEETTTGYVVEALEVASAYDPDADE
ncbi:hypothetical protein [Streptomyces sp. AMCC400023]|uniref:hypothetical protein n=1 Tax=Streptomyces sp. AMCC400023 TaxID=2056258 RepID=UPI001F176B68|nr:hypothetical protein [Streptomyces sp. AMCC400023]UJV43843.1 hypothetical protein CVT30_32015 [Streptomyces sp. AMCC400023]